MRRSLLAALLLVLSSAGCGKADAGSTGAASTAAPASGTTPVTEVDFEAEADAQIDASNMEAELAALEKEIAGGQ